jgi:glutathione peroxidase
MPDTAVHDIALQRIDGRAASLSEYRGKVLLIVNVASKCGLTPQYAGLEALYRRLCPAGLEVLGFPCNDFGAQEPGAEDEIAAFPNANYGVSFPLFAKVNANSAPRHPLYGALIAACPQALGSDDGKLRETLARHGLLPALPTDILWNFEKFLLARDGRVLARFAPDITPDSPVLLAAIESALSAPAPTDRS